MTVEAIDANIYGVEVHPYLEIAIHMREATFVDSLETTFNDCIWRERATILRTILHYSKAILANI